MRKKPASMRALEELGRVRLSQNFFLRDFLYSEISGFYGLPNVPDDPDLMIAAGRRLCEELLEPIEATFGRIAIRSAYRAPALNAFGNENKLNCARNETSYAGHIWDRRGPEGEMGATACIVIPWFADLYADGADWRAMAWWVHDHLPYSAMEFFPKLAAFNLTWSERPARTISSYIPPRGYLTRPGMDNHEGRHGEWYEGFPPLKMRG
ncbi:hypothetical protein J2R99_001474 [Rhodopseudomonas julia]|uniref:Peptidase M15 n=1 Tax=Rhodopseudomonas julia TaxID=200617 RepID=A0ABU0C7L6_9BRAD|nr:hypothetical protein [Rhodopseudomonas julia]MDQ0325625.1 hypothetical protein [Rhodopseudomonas julia]